MSKKKKPQKPDTSIRIEQRDKLKDGLEIREFNWKPKQKQIIDTILDNKTKIVFIDGVAGTAKTLLSVYCGLRLLSDQEVGEVTYIRTIIESASKSMGAMPGTYENKIELWLAPLEDKLNELLKGSDKKRLISENRITSNAVNFLRGTSYRTTYILADEVNNFTWKELVTLMTRVGERSKLVIIGDSFQSDINGKSALKPMYEVFDNEESRLEGIHCFKLGKEDIVRSGILKFILDKIEKYQEISDSFKK